MYGILSLELVLPPLTSVIDFGFDGTVQDFIAACAERNPPLDRLSLANMELFSESDAAQLAGVVGELAWDGY